MTSKLKTILALAVLLSTVAMAVPRPAHADFDLFGLFPKEVEGIVSAVSSNNVMLIAKNNKPYVFVFKPGTIPPPGLTPGRRVRIEYKKRADGMPEVKKLEFLQI